MRWPFLCSLSLGCIAFLYSSAATRAADIRTIAGNGRQTYSGDGGPRQEAGLARPFGPTIGPDGSLYVGSVKNHCIRRIDEKTGFITTVAGSGQMGYAGDGRPASRALCNEPYEVRFDAE